MGMIDNFKEGSQLAAQVLLSASHGASFQLNVTDLFNLDSDNYVHALAVIRGRYELRREPQEMITDSSNVFRALRTQWARLELTERAKIRCPNCDGGKIYKNEDDEIGVVCSRCAGKSRICGCE